MQVVFLPAHNDGSDVVILSDFKTADTCFVKLHDCHAILATEVDSKCSSAIQPVKT